ncbi:GDP-L-fucose synthase [Candidatus Pelagibacter ubique]|nr:GDP-L-fucose synthase [Candidatus Pelagibacter ubique]
MNNPKIYIAGHTGMVGSSIIRVLRSKGFTNLIYRKHSDLDLIDQAAVKDFFLKEKPDQVYLSAAKVGGIQANNVYPADFLYQNLMIQTNVIDSAFQNNVKKLLFLGSSCIYPKHTEQPISEEALLSGKLEPTNEPYAIAKISGIKICESYNRQYGESHNIDYRCIMPSNLYGPGDNYSDNNSHVIPSLIRRFHEAKINKLPDVIVWGTGKPRREFLYVDDLAEACVLLMNIDKSKYDKIIDKMNIHINVGFSEDLTIEELSIIIKEIVNYKGEIKFDTNKPDGTAKKLLNSHRIKKLGWEAKVNLKEGLSKTYKDYLKYK